jgi:hypothetical protein
MGLTGKFSLSHDTLARSIFTDEFLKKNPDFEFMRTAMEQCKQTYSDEIKKKGCSCRVDGSWSEPCLSVVLPALEQANKTNHTMVRNFVRFVARKPDDVDIDGLGVNVIYKDKTYSIFVDTEEEALTT